MTTINTTLISTLITKALISESGQAWEAGLQNCAGPISPEGAEKIALRILRDAGLSWTPPCGEVPQDCQGACENCPHALQNDLPVRPCNCGSGLHWSNCGGNEFCG